MNTTGRYIQTVRGEVSADSLGLVLPHEHLFVDLRGPLTPGYAQGEPEGVGRLLQPYLDAAHRAGVTALVECSTLGVGRNVRVLEYLASITPIHIIAPTGVYREAFTPPDLRDLSAETLAEGWIRDLTEGMDGTTIRAGFIKIAMSDDGPTPLEVRNLHAAAIASQETGAVIGSHTIGGRAARDEMNVLEGAGLNLKRFIWIHTQTEPDVNIHIEAAKRGAYVEYDSIGANPADDPKMLDAVIAVLEAGYGDHILLSHDAGWYEPGQPEGRPAQGVRGYTALIDSFIPALKARGISDAEIYRMTVVNPARAFALTLSSRR